MSQPVQLSDELVTEATTIATIAERSVAGQIEHRAKLGRAVEALLGGDRIVPLGISASELLSETIATVDTDAGRKRVFECLSHRSYPHFEPVPDRPGWLYRIQEDGTRDTGRFVNRQFVAE